jgi:K+-sensing histidine kinase KdpD
MKQLKNEILKDFLNTILKKIMATIKADCGSLFLFDPDSKELILDAFYNSGNLSLQGLKKKIGEGISGKVADINRPILVKDINNDARFRRNGFNHYRTNSFISIPLFTSTGLVGLINLADKSSGESFSEKDLETAIVICGYACMTIDSFMKSSSSLEEKKAGDTKNLALEKYASVGKLAAGVVHEINNPLDGVIRYVNMLLGQAADDSVSKEYLTEAKKGLTRIANITKSLLDFSHQVNSNHKEIRNYVDPHALIEESLDVLKQKVDGKIFVNKKYKENLPRLLDFGLSHVFTNITKNALDAMPDGGTLEISTDINDSMVKITFKDTGTGIAPEIKDRLFEPFFTTKAMGKGTGLGLPISKEIVSKYTGTIEVESNTGKGTVFTILIPKQYLENV